MDKLLFRKACDKVLSEARGAAAGNELSGGIGTLGEKTLHAVLKNYFQPNAYLHEIKIGGYVADIVSDKGIIEIQTRQLIKLRKKLGCFLSETDVTVVYPVARTKWLIWIDESTGEITKKRRSPKTGRAYEALTELYMIKSLLRHPRLQIHVVLLDLEEYRYLNGWSRDRKKGSSRYDRIPVDIAGELVLRTPADYAGFIPEELPERFTSRDFKTASGLWLKQAQTALNVLHYVGAVRRTGKSGNAFVYERNTGNLYVE